MILRLHIVIRFQVFLSNTNNFPIDFLLPIYVTLTDTITPDLREPGKMAIGFRLRKL